MIFIGQLPLKFNPLPSAALFSFLAFSVFSVHPLYSRKLVIGYALQYLPIVAMTSCPLLPCNL
jgi:hypothetical protein